MFSENPSLTVLVFSRQMLLVNSLIMLFWLILFQHYNYPPIIAKLTNQDGHDIPTTTLCSPETSIHFWNLSTKFHATSLLLYPLSLPLWFSFYTFGTITEFVLERIRWQSRELILVIDQYFEISIKGGERD